MTRRRRYRRGDHGIGAWIEAHADILLTGTVLAIDPASGRSSACGYAVAKRGKYVEHGTIEVDGSKPIQYCLRELYDTLVEEQPDVLIVERIRGRMAHEYLRWAVGVIQAAVCAPRSVEMPVPCWRRYVRETYGSDYEKSDSEDARMILEATLDLARKART